MLKIFLQKANYLGRISDKMRYSDNKVEEIKIAYIGGGSRLWAWTLMRDLASCAELGGDIYLYDIDHDAAKCNEIVGNKHNSTEGAVGFWNYHAVESIDDALKNADFVIVSILPGTFDEMEIDVHAPEKYGIYQSVGDTMGPGGIIRAMRSIPMFEEIAENIKRVCPDAWVINYTNPMTLCTKTLYRVFPQIKLFGCCHEVFGTQKFLAKIIEEKMGITGIERQDIKVNPIGVNHFTWLTEAKYKNIDLFPMYKQYCLEHPDGVKGAEFEQPNWDEEVSATDEKVKMDLFRRFGYIAAAGDRHLAEFCEGKWYLESPERVREMHFALTSVAWRKRELEKRIDRRTRVINGEEDIVIKKSGEEGVNQIKALLGLEDLVTNVNLPNVGQIPNLPLGAVVETNAVFRSGSIIPVCAGPIPKSIYPLISRVCGEQEMISEGIAERNLDKIFNAFSSDALVTCSLSDAKKLFKEMVNSTKEYLTSYDLSTL